MTRTALLLFCFVASAAFAAAAPEVREVRIWAAPDSTRVVLDVSSRIEHTLFTLHDPERVVVDILNGRMSRAALPAGQGVIKQIRGAPRESGDLRVVLDLARPVQAKSFMALPNGTYGYRLVIDLTPPAEAVPVRAEHAPGNNARDLIIAIDAGHGGEDPGAIGRKGTREKNVTLAIARALRDAVAREPGMQPYLTRDGDYFVQLPDRMRKARAKQADIFVSIHADSIRDRSIAGSSVYVLSARGASDTAARILAERENAADLIGGVSLDDKDNVLASVLLDLSQSASMTASMDAAERVLGQLDTVGEIRKTRVQQARFVVLKSPDVASLLVETAYISNPGEEQRLKDPGHQTRLAAAILAGVRGYFYENPPPGTRIAQLSAALRSGHAESADTAATMPLESASTPRVIASTP